MITIVLVALLVMVFAGLPIAIALSGSTLLPWLLNNNFTGNPMMIMRSMIGALDSVTLLAIPMFMLSGAIMARGGISKRLFDVFALAIGKRTAGIPCAVIVTCLFYGAISGSGPATVAAVGVMCVPVMLELGYNRIFSCALICVAGSLGVIIPPSLPMISYSLMTGTSVGDLFKGGVLPGILIALFLMIYTYIYCRKNGEDKEKVRANHDALKARGWKNVLKDGFWALLCPVIILGSIYSGICTPTESACISVWYALFISMFVYKSMSLKDIPEFLCQSIKSYSGICMMLCVSQAFAKIITLLKAPALLAGFISANLSNRYAFLLVIIVAMFIIGMFVDSGPATTILSPILLPSAVALGIHPVHFGIVLVCCLGIGLVTPPFGLNLFVGAPIVNEEPLKIGKAVIPFIGFFLIALLFIAFVPALSLC